VTGLLDEALGRELLEAYAEEAEQRLHRVNAALLVLEHRPGAEDRSSAIAELRREAHTLKGAARAAELLADAATAHALEDVLDELAAADGPDPALHAAAYAHVDALTRSVAHLRGEAGEAGEAVTGPAELPPAEDRVSVSTGTLDALMGDVGQLLAARAALAGSMGELLATATDLFADAATRPIGASLHESLRRLGGEVRAVERTTATLQRHVHRARMLPVAGLLAGFPRMVRDLAVEHGKAVELRVRGADVEVDRVVLDGLRPALTQLLRNAVEHGIELPDERRAAGKPPTGTITVEVREVGAEALVEVSDDGGGVDRDAVVRVALDRRLVDAGRVALLSRGEVLDLLFLPGLSTKETVTQLAGRGVGLDTVRRSVDDLQGTVELASAPSATTFRLRVPLTLAVRYCVLVGIGAHTYAVPVTAVQRVIDLRTARIGTVGGRGVVAVGDEVLPLHALDAETPTGGSDLGAVGLLCATGRRRAVLAADVLLGVAPQVVEPVPWPLGGTAAGVCLPAGGAAVPVLDVATLLGSRSAPVRLPDPAPSTDAASPLVLVVEDSITTRTLERSILETAGFRVRTAADGAEGWRVLQAEEEPIDLALVDVAMPEVDGIELTRRIRAHPRLRDLPVVIVTSLTAPEDRRRGAEAGADAYITKGEFDQETLIATVRRLL
jgi:two-component system, chemotaxis family, sensor kinase CheA